MKIGGVEVSGPSEEVLILPRPLAQDIVIRCKAVLDMSEFEALCPEPKAKPMLVAGGFKENDKDPGYLEQCRLHSEQRFAFISLKSLEPSNIEWETVQMENPNTWKNWEKDLRESGLSSIEINRIIVCIMQANALDETKLEQARKSFLLGLGAQKEKSSGPDTEPKNTPSGEPVVE